MKGFKVKIKKETFDELSEDKTMGLNAEDEYDVVDVIGQKLLIVNEEGEFFEMYPRRCYVVEKE